MKRSALTLAVLLLLALAGSGSLRASSILYDSLVNVNGSLTEGSFSIPGLNSSGFNTATGEGTLVFTFAPGSVGSFFFDIWLDHDLSAPSFNEYGAVTGTPAPGQTWQIGDPSAYYDSGVPPGGLGPGVDIVDNAALNALSNTNDLPGNTDNFLGDCAGGTCNGDASLALGFAFTLAADQEEIITLNISETAPSSGFFLQQIHPVDGCDQDGLNCANPAQLNLYFSGTAVTQGSGGQVPEPGTWLLVSGAGAVLLFFRARNHGAFRRNLARVRAMAVGPLMMLVVLLLLPGLAQSQITVLTVPWVPATPSTPHTTYNLCSDGSIPNYSVKPPTCTAPATLTEATIVLGATAILPNTTDTYTGVWNFGDGSSNYTFTVSNASLNNYDVSTTHQYPATAAAGTIWTAVLTITDNNTSVQGSGSYPVIQEGDTTQPPPNGGLRGRLNAMVNVAIDRGLWFSHTAMWRGTTTVDGNTVNWGGWDDYGEPCINGNICGPYGGLDANFLQAFEVNGHLENGRASDPYTDDVARGMARLMNFLQPQAVTQKTVSYDPSIMVDRCSDGTPPNFGTSPPTCMAPATLIEYNSHATSCTSPPCTFTFDQNSNGQMLNAYNDSGYSGYEIGMYVDAIVASGNPSGTAKAGTTAGSGLPGVYGQTYLDIVKDLVDHISYCQYGGDPYDGTSNGYYAGGGWSYYCAAADNGYDDNSISQWNAVGLIGAQRGFGVSIDPIVTDTNQVWVTYSQEVNASEGSFTGIANNSLVGAFGYYEYAYEPWGPFAVTPSGMVQMAMDGVGRTAAGSADQRWNMAETFYHDNFCFNSAQNYGPSDSGYYYDPLYYTYGMFSFSKSMLLYAPGGVLSPITYLEDQPSGTNPIDWYGALSPANGGTDACDGFAQTLLSRQNSDGHWGYPSYYDENTSQSLFETPWALIILKGNLFGACINNLYGKGKPAIGPSPAQVTLTWSHQPNSTAYDIYRTGTSGGTLNKVGHTTSTVFVDTTRGLVNNHTYYYVVNPLNSLGTSICQSNTATVTIPKAH